jgi:O-antigen/teichoic acid export membrane protein
MEQAVKLDTQDTADSEVSICVTPAAPARLRDSVAGGAFSQVAARIATLPLGLASMAMLSRFLGVEGYGKYAFVMAYWGVANLASEMYVTPVVAGELGRDATSRRRVWIAGVLVQLTYAMVIAVVGVIAAFVFFGRDPQVIAGLLAGTLLILSSLSVTATIHQARLRMWVPAAFSVLQSALVLVSVVLLRWMSGGWQLFVVGNALAGVFAVGGVFVSGLPAATGSLRHLKQEYRHLLVATLGIGAAGLVSVLYYKVDSILVFSLAGAAQAGLYGAAYRLYELAMFVPSAVQMAAMPVLARAFHEHGRQGEPTRFRTRACAVVQVLFLLGTLAALILLLFRTLVVGLVFGAAFSAAATLLLLLLPGLVARFVHVWLGALLILRGERRRFLIVVSVASVVAIMLDVALIPLLQARGAAVVTSVTEIVMLVGTWMAQGRTLSPQMSRGPAALLSALREMNHA